MQKQMTAENVIDIYQDLHERGVQIWLDGGWGVDALLERQTRPHNDVDIVVQEKDIEKLQKFFDERGFVKVPRDDARAWNYVVGNDTHGEIDVHVINIGENGDGIYGPKENGQAYPASSLTGTGKINETEVQCLSAEYQVESHSGYELKEKDFNDVSALCEKFNIALPKEYEKFLS